MIRPLVTALLASLLVLPAAAKEVKQADAAKLAPDVSLTSSTGEIVRIGQLKGRVVLVDFFASWCIPCRRSFPAVDALSREFKDRGLVVIAVNVDEERKNADLFLEKYPHTMQVAFDPTGAAADAFKVQAMPSSIFVDRAGLVRKKHMGYGDKTIDQFRADVLQLLEEAQ